MFEGQSHYKDLLEFRAIADDIAKIGGRSVRELLSASVRILYSQGKTCKLSKRAAFSLFLKAALWRDAMCPFTGCVSIREIWGDGESKVIILFRMIPGCRYQQQHLKGKTIPNQGSTSAKYVSSTDGFVQKRPSTKQIIKNK